MALSKIQAESMNLADTYAFSGTVSGASDFVHISTSSGTSLNELEFTNFSTDYGMHILFFKDLYLSSDSDIRARFRTSAGRIDSSSYNSSGQMRSSSGSTTTGNVTGTNSFQIINAIDNNGGGENIRSSFSMYIPQTSSGNNPSYYGHGYQQAHNGNRNTINFAGIHAGITDTVTGIYLYPSSGNFAQISVSLYGVKNA
jgi:hypothetical protein